MTALSGGGDALSQTGKVPFFSIVMPAYQAEKYLDETLRSIEGQSFEDWELIVVDDGCTDSTVDIVRSHARVNGKIRLVSHEHNRGLSAARNTGIEEARGRYLWFPDSDDWFDRDTLERVHDALTTGDFDVAIFGVVEEYYNADGAPVGKSRVVKPRAQVCSNQVAVRSSVLEWERETLYGYATMKAYRRKSIGAVRFEDDVPFIEDFLFNVGFFENASSAVCLDFAPYHYRKMIAKNLTNAFSPRYFEMHRRRIQELRDQLIRFGIYDEGARGVLGRLFVRYIMSALERNCDARTEIKHAQRKAWCRALFADSLFLELVPCADSGGGALITMVARLLAMHRTTGCLVVGRVIHIVRTRFGGLFMKLRYGI